MEGGPGALLLKRLALAHAELGVTAVRTALMLVALSWLPLFALSLAEGLALRGPKIPFCYDIAAQTRFLLAVPVLVLTEVPVGRQLRATVRRFLASHLVRKSEFAEFERLLVEAMKWRDSRITEILLLGLVYLSSAATVFRAPYESGSSWYHPGPETGLSMAGYWYTFVSLPVFQFLVLRWVYRVAIWTRCLRNISKLDLALTPTHPDRAGGLGFLSQSLPPFGMILFALSSVASAIIANRILFDGEKLQEYQWGYLVLFLLLAVVFSGPLLVFTPKLLSLKEHGIHQYSELASTFNRAFHTKWLDAADMNEESLLANSDIQSQAALESSFQVVREIRPVPVELGDFLTLILPGLIPALPLLFTVVPAGVVFKALMKLVANAA